MVEIFRIRKFVCLFFRQLDFNEFLETVIDRQGDSRDMHDEILKGFSLFDQGIKFDFLKFRILEILNFQP